MSLANLPVNILCVLALLAPGCMSVGPRKLFTNSSKGTAAKVDGGKMASKTGAADSQVPTEKSQAASVSIAKTTGASGEKVAPSAGEAKAARQQHVAAMEASTLKLIDDELRDATPEERAFWFDQLKKVDPALVPDILSARRMSLKVGDRGFSSPTIGEKSPAAEAEMAWGREVPVRASGQRESAASVVTMSAPVAADADDVAFDARQSAERRASEGAGAQTAVVQPTIVLGLDDHPPSLQTPPSSWSGHGSDRQNGLSSDTRDVLAALAGQGSMGRVGSDATLQAAAYRALAANSDAAHPNGRAGQFPGQRPDGLSTMPAGATKFSAAKPADSSHQQAGELPVLPAGFGTSQTPVRGTDRFMPVSSASPSLPGTPGMAHAGLTTGDTLSQLIANLESEVAELKPGGTEEQRQQYLRKQVDLRLLYLMAGRQERALTAIPGIEPADQEFWQQLMWGVSNYFDHQQIPSASDRASQAVSQLSSAVRSLQEKAGLELRNVAFCKAIDYFGNYERFTQDEFTPGQEVLVYAEVENFQSELASDGQFRTLLRSTIELMSPGGEVRKQISFAATEDFCRTARRDYFHNYKFAMPETMPLGPHVLKLTVFDELGNKMATYTVNFLVR